MLTIRVLLLAEESQSDELPAPREGQSARISNREHEVGLALEVINLVFRQLKSNRRTQKVISGDGRQNAPSPDIERQISHAVWVHWNSPSPAVSYKIKNTLRNLLEHTKNYHPDFSQSQVPQFFLESIKGSILIEKRSLSILCYLLPCMPIKFALQAFKLYAVDPEEFLRMLLNAVGDDKLASTAGQLAVHWTSKIESFESKTPEAIGAPSPYHSNWISIALDILFDSEERKRQYLCQYYLVPLFKSWPECFKRLTETISSMVGPRFELLTSNASFDQLSAIISLARINPRRNSTSNQSFREHSNVFDPWLPDSLLKVCLLHPAVSLRSSALAILCQPSSLTAVVSTEYLNLVLDFFALNFGETEAELKQNIFSSLNVLFNKLQDFSHSLNKKLSNCHNRTLNSKQSPNALRVEESPCYDQEAIQVRGQIDQYTSSIETLKWFFIRFSKLCRVNLSICSPYRCQIASLTYLLVLLNTGIDPMYSPIVSKLATGPVGFPFKIEIIDQLLINKLLLALTSTYGDVKEASLAILQRCLALDTDSERISNLKHQVASYAIHCLNSRRESENGTATLMFRLLLQEVVAKNLELPAILLSHLEHQCPSTNPSAIFLHSRLDDLEIRIVEAETNLGQAFEKRPLQGSIMVLSALFMTLPTDMVNSLVVSQDLMPIIKRTKRLILRVWELSAAVLCPSIFQPTDLLPDHEEARAYEFVPADDEGELLDDEQVVTDKNFMTGTRHKAILSACWRSMKEISALLMNTVKLSLNAGQTDVTNDPDRFLSYQDLIDVGEMFETWLLEIRHRGAFGGIHTAYSSLCGLLCTLPQESPSSQLPAMWLRAHICAITNRQISTTRRSAGLPYCILSTCQALSISSTKNLRDCLDLILELSEKENLSAEARVHILNTLKILLTDGKVAPHLTSLFIERSYKFAIKSFVSTDWRVRNGALILFSGLINRVLGTRCLTLDRSHSNLRKRETLSDFFRRLPSMPMILLKELRRSIEAGIHDVSNNHSQGPIFAVLSLLALLQNPDCASSAEEFIPLVQECLKSKVSKIRSISADAMTGLVPSNKVSSAICESLTKVTKPHVLNYIHGLLLSVSRLVQLPSLLSTQEKLNIQETLVPAALVLLNRPAIPLLCQSSFLEILEDLDTRFGIKSGLSFFSPSLLLGRIEKMHNLRTPALYSYESRAIRSLLRKHPTRETVLKLLREGSPTTRLIAFEFLEMAEHQSLANDSEVFHLILSSARRITDSVSVRLPALKLLAAETASSNLDHAKWSLTELLEGYHSIPTIPTRDSILILAGCILVNSAGKLACHEFSVEFFAEKILTLVEEASREEKSTETRLSAAKCLTSIMKLNKICGDLSIEIKTRIVNLMINLIQDDDDDIRLHLIRSIHRTCFLQSTNEALESKQFDLRFQSVPNAALRKLISMALVLDPFFGFRKLMKMEDLTSDLSQLREPSAELFVKERFNLHRDDPLEFNLIQEKSLEVFSCLKRLGENSGEEKECDEKTRRIFEGANIDEELRTFHNLFKILTTSFHGRVKEINLSKGLFANLNNCAKIGQEPPSIHSFRAWISLSLRLYHAFMIFKSFPEKYQTTYVLLMNIEDQSHDPQKDTEEENVRLETLMQDFNDQFHFFQKVFIASQ